MPGSGRRQVSICWRQAGSSRPGKAEPGSKQAAPCGAHMLYMSAARQPGYQAWWITCRGNPKLPPLTMKLLDSKAWRSLCSRLSAPLGSEAS